MLNQPNKMKTSLLTFFLALGVSLTCYAQTEKGTKMIGGSGAINLQGGISAHLQPKFGYFVADGLAVGSGVLFGYSRWKNLDLRVHQQEVALRSLSVGLQPFVRYYFGETATTRVFVQANTSLTYTNRSGYDYYYTPFDQSNSFTQTSVGGGIGIVHFLTEQVGLEAQVAYRNNSYGYDTFNR
jgi:hypothetical protein